VRTCKSCGERKEAGEFSAQRRVCRSCRTTVERERRRVEREAAQKLDEEEREREWRSKQRERDAAREHKRQLELDQARWIAGLQSNPRRTTVEARPAEGNTGRRRLLPKGSSYERGYGPHHRRLRKQLLQAVEAGEAVFCARCGDAILPGQKVDLGHVDGSGKTAYSGLEHSLCNRRAGGRLGAAVTNGNREPRIASREW
jgi:hypothetical protein